MNKRSEDEAELKRYLLGELAEEERLVIEERLFLDSDYLLQLQAVEDDLVDDYVYDDLPASDRRNFETRFLSRPGRDGDVRFARALKKHVTAEEVLALAPSATDDTVKPQAKGKVSFFLFPFKHNPSVGIALAIAAVVILAVFVWLAVESIRRRQPEPIQAQRSEPPHPSPTKAPGDAEADNLQRNAGGSGQGTSPVESDNASNRAGGKQGREQSPQQARRGAEASPSPQQASGRAFTFLLLPGGAVRGEGEINRVILPSGTASLILQLPLIESENYRSYQATLQQGNRTIRTWNALKPGIAEAGKIISVSIPASILQAQSYRVTLVGLDASGSSHKVMDYSFQLEKR
ncbi:MAG TPA: hypothetical protein VF553_07185 [Pyrinomonadaceae bacterium]|jgi:hypothetical protein